MHCVNKVLYHNATQPRVNADPAVAAPSPVRGGDKKSVLAKVQVEIHRAGYALVGPLKSIGDKNQIDKKKRVGYTGAIGQRDGFLTEKRYYEA